MPHRYTDVDQMILSRWPEVAGLRDAFDDLLNRMREVLTDALAKVSVQAQERGYASDYDARRPSVSFWKKEWETKTSKEAGVYFFICDFAPSEYGKSEGNFPTLELWTDQLSKIKIKDRQAFAKDIKAELSPELRGRWDDAANDPDQCPLAVQLRDISEAQRVRWMAEPATLVQFLLERLDECGALVPAVNRALEKGRG